MERFAIGRSGGGGGGGGVASELPGGARQSGRYEVGPRQLREATSSRGFIFYFYYRVIVVKYLNC